MTGSAGSLCQSGSRDRRTRITGGHNAVLSVTVSANRGFSISSGNQLAVDALPEFLGNFLMALSTGSWDVEMVDG